MSNAAEILKQNLSKRELVELARDLLKGTGYRVETNTVSELEAEKHEVLNAQFLEPYAGQLVNFLNQKYGESKKRFSISVPGSIYTRVYTEDLTIHGDVITGSKSVYCFVRNYDGAILKAAGWSAPYVKGFAPVRGWVKSVVNGSQAVDQYGSWLYQQ